MMNNSQRVNPHSRDVRLRAAIETAVYCTIFENSSFTIDIPKLSPDLWDRVSIITPENKEENERLEFLGDTLMDSSIAIDLYKCIPDGTPHKYTLLLNILHANRTFCHFARKMRIENSGHDTKSTGDIVEAIIGAYYTEKGFDAVHAWASRLYQVLICDASKAFDDCLREINSELSAAADNPTGSPKKSKGKATRRPSGTYSSPPYPVPSFQPGPSTPGRRRPSYTATFAEPSTPRTHTASASPHISEPTQSNLSTSPRSSPLASPIITNSRRSEPMSPRSPLYSSYDSDDEPLPEFWEKVPHEGRMLFVNHKTQTTTWDDPRHAHGPLLSGSEDDEDHDASWRARLMAGDSDHEDLIEPAGLSDDSIEPFPELLEEGYERDDGASAGVTALPDFWEERQGQDGRTYYIDHPNSKFMVRDYGNH